MAHSSNIVLIAAVFLASAVEMVEALTIVVAAGTTRGWRPAFEGVGAALLALAALVAVLGPAIVTYVPLSALRVVIGGVLLVFGLQWLRKAVLRSSGLQARHDEDAIFARNVAELSKTGTGARAHDALGFTVAFKGVFLEGLEVVIIVLTLGATAHRLGLAALSAGAAAVVVAAVGVVVALMLVSFGTFWSGEGLGVHWPGSDLAIVALVGFYAVLAWLSASVLKKASRDVQPV